MPPMSNRTALIERWIRYPEKATEAPIRLFCLPYAGGTAAVYRGWPSELPGVEVATVEIPGRGDRTTEPPYDRIEPLVAALADAVLSHLDKPYALFGHSMGARIGFELARELRRRSAPMPELLFVSGCRAPHLPRIPGPPLASLPDGAFLDMLNRINGTPVEVLADPETYDLLVPVLRADMNLVHSYVYTDEPALPCPIHAFGGTDDPEVAEDALLDWRAHTTASFRLRRLPGGHFVLRSRQREMTASILEDLRAR